MSEARIVHYGMRCTIALILLLAGCGDKAGARDPRVWDLVVEYRMLERDAADHQARARSASDEARRLAHQQGETEALDLAVAEQKLASTALTRQERISKEIEERTGRRASAVLDDPAYAKGR